MSILTKIKKEKKATLNLFGCALFIIFSLTFNSCTSQTYTANGSSTSKSSSSSSSTQKSSPTNKKYIESREYQQFTKGGVEKKLNTARTSPDQLIKTAEKYIGTPHCMGGTTKKCMDCSGLLITTFKTHNITLPHSSQEQARYGTIITNAQLLKRGDLVFFTRSYKTSNFITHSGIYLGNNQFIHASSSQGVTITPLSSTWWKERFVFGTRIF